MAEEVEGIENAGADEAGQIARHDPEHLPRFCGASPSAEREQHPMKSDADLCAVAINVKNRTRAIYCRLHQGQKVPGYLEEEAQTSNNTKPSWRSASTVITGAGRCAILPAYW